MSRLLLITFFFVSPVFSADFEMKVSINTGTYEIIFGEPINAEIAFVNNGKENIVLQSAELHEFRVEVMTNGVKVDMTRFGHQLLGEQDEPHPPPPIFISPGETVKLSPPLPLSRAFDLSVVGAYKIRVTYNSGGHSTRCEADISIISPEEFARRNANGNNIRERNQMRRDRNAATVKSVPFDEPDKNFPHAINVSSTVEKFSLGSSPIRIVYNNKSETDPWITPKPDTCARLIVYVTQGDMTDLYVLNQSFHMILRKDLSRIAVGPKDQLFQIKPGTTFEFPLDICTIPIDWKPGVYELWLRDDNAKLGSNKIKFRLEANEYSIPLLTKMASDEIDEKKAIQFHLREIRRNFALTWLAKNFSLHVLPITDDDTTPVVEAKLAQNRNFINEFLQKWPTRKDSEETKSLFYLLNSNLPAKTHPDPTALWNQINPNKNNPAVKPPAPPAPTPKVDPAKPPAPPPEKPVKPPTAPNDF